MSLVQLLSRCAIQALLLAGALPAASSAAAAEPALVRGSPFELQGTTLEGQPLSMAGLRGKVVLVFFWSTDCAVCRSKMPELRANQDGWRGKPFEVVSVSFDRHRADPLAYQRVVAQSAPGSGTILALWAGDAGYRGSVAQRPHHLPLSVLVDAQGRVVQTFEGRIPAEAWDTIADLVP